jgi:hypothetical protein
LYGDGIAGGATLPGCVGGGGCLGDVGGGSCLGDVGGGGNGGDGGGGGGLGKNAGPRGGGLGGGGGGGGAGGGGDAMRSDDPPAYPNGAASACTHSSPGPDAMNLHVLPVTLKAHTDSVARRSPVDEFRSAPKPP